MKRLTILLCALTITSNAWAFRCGHELVHVGEHKFDVLEKCGDPDSMEERIAVRGSRLRHPYGSLQLEEYKEILIEEWIYNFGPRKFKQFLYFEDGVLKEIHNLGHGY